MRLRAIGIILVLLVASPAFAQKEAKKAKAAEPDKVVLATVNDKTITLADFQTALSALPPQQQLVALQNRQDFLDSLVKRELVHQEANRHQLENDPEVVAVLEKLKKEVLIQAVLRKVIEEVGEVDDVEAERFFLDNKEKFKTPEKIKASHIVLKSEDEAKTTLADLKKGQDFAALAKERSIGPRASQGGYLGRISRGEMPTEFDDKAFDLTVGDLSEVVKTPFGYHIIKVSEHIPPRQLSFADVSQQIQNRLRAERQQKAVKDFLDNLTKDASIDVHPERLTDSSPRSSGLPSTPSPTNPSPARK
jgi:peptidyl-prolyl cis-trans isomerase C